jgi:hypothetical protein
MAATELAPAKIKLRHNVNDSGTLREVWVLRAGWPADRLRLMPTGL